MSTAKERAEKYLAMPCLGYKCGCPGEPTDYDCGYPNAEVCDVCVCNFGFACATRAWDPDKGKWIGKKVLKAMKAILIDEYKKPLPPNTRRREELIF